MAGKSGIFGFGLGAKRTAKGVTKQLPVSAEKQKPQQLPPFHVVVLNDEDHSYQYVIQMLAAVFAYSESRGMALAKQIDATGRAIVFTSHKELAELKREQIQSYGADHRVSSCRGSMSAIIEAA